MKEMLRKAVSMKMAITDRKGSVLRQTKRLKAVSSSQGINESVPITKYLPGLPPHTFNIEGPKRLRVRLVLSDASGNVDGRSLVHH